MTSSSPQLRRKGGCKNCQECSEGWISSSVGLTRELSLFANTGYARGLHSSRCWRAACEIIVECKATSRSLTRGRSSSEVVREWSEAIIVVVVVIPSQSTASNLAVSVFVILVRAIPIAKLAPVETVIKAKAFLPSATCSRIVNPPALI